jgi:heme/copper-type cytochrome/quinol oxidase subunit 1
MPLLSRLFIRAALLYLALGFTLGALLLFHKGISLHPLMWRLLPAHIECLLFGWTVQLAMGVMFWIFPRLGGGTSRGNERAAWIAFALLNAGVWLVIAPSWFDLPSWFSFSGRVLEAGAVLSFALHAWPRIKPMSRPNM